MIFIKIIELTLIISKTGYFMHFIIILNTISLHHIFMQSQQKLKKYHLTIQQKL